MFVSYYMMLILIPDKPVSTEKKASNVSFRSGSIEKGLGQILPLSLHFELEKLSRN
jgi:hypothetical protein